jgi:serine/threonine-protein kinase RsbW
VRRRLVDDLAHHGVARDVIEDAALLVSEMVGNAVRYAYPLPGNVLVASWEYTGGRLLLRVTDGGGRNQPHVRDAGPFDTRGRGLAIIDAMAAAWGVKRGENGHGPSCTVWAELPTDRNPGHPAEGPCAAEAL